MDTTAKQEKPRFRMKRRCIHAYLSRAEKRDTYAYCYTTAARLMRYGTPIFPSHPMKKTYTYMELWQWHHTTNGNPKISKYPRPHTRPTPRANTNYDTVYTPRPTTKNPQKANATLTNPPEKSTLLSNLLRRLLPLHSPHPPRSPAAGHAAGAARGTARAPGLLPTVKRLRGRRCGSRGPVGAAPVPAAAAGAGTAVRGGRRGGRVDTPRGGFGGAGEAGAVGVAVASVEVVAALECTVWIAGLFV